MAKVQRRRSISFSAAFAAHIHQHCAAKNISQSSYLERLVEADIGLPPSLAAETRPAGKGQFRRAHAAAKRASAPPQRERPEKPRPPSLARPGSDAKSPTRVPSKPTAFARASGPVF
jgi:hypothetical protein